MAKLFVRFGEAAMSKIGRKAISLNDLSVQKRGHELSFKGKLAAGSYVLPEFIEAEVVGDKLFLRVSDKLLNSETNRFWGMHRALLANALQGASAGFTRQLQIHGLGYKAVASGNKVVFSLGYTHKIDLELPKEVTLEIDKPGQLLTFRSTNKELLGQVCDQVRSMRPPEPYKGKGVKYATEVIIRKAGKTKAAS